MKVKKQYIIGFLLIFLFGVGLIIGGLIHHKSTANLVETQATVVGGVETDTTDDGIRYRPFLLRYYVDGKMYEISTSVWFDYYISTGDTITIYYKKSKPRETVVSNVSRETMTYVFIGCGAVCAVAGIVLTGKYLYDVKHGKHV